MADNGISFFPFQNVGGDRMYSDSDFAWFYAHIFKNGVIATFDGGLAVTASSPSSMIVNVAGGAAMINGRQFFSTSSTPISITPASTAQNRTDSIVVQLDLPNRQMQFKYKEGDVTVVRTDSIWEIQLASIFVPQNASSITASNITDSRSDDTVGGYSTPFEELSVATMQEHYSELMEVILDQATADSAQNNQDQQENLQLQYSTFQTWLAGLQSQLTDNQAANLLALINSILPSHDAGVTITHDFNGYPNVNVFSWEYGLGLVGLGDEPDGFFGGGNVISAPSKIEYLDESHLKIYLPDDIMLSEPAITDQGDGRYLLTEGHRSVGVLIENNGYKN